MGKMIFIVIGAIAELERSLIRERVMMGLDRVRRQDQKLGRPLSLLDRERVAALRAQGFSFRQIAITLNLSKDTVARVCKH
jgi:DNA invertase Pin-like site-specific DNA recombinase